MFVQMTQSSSSSSYSSYSSSSSKTVKSSSSVTQSSMTSSHSSSNVSIRSGGSTFADKYGKDLGIDVDSKMAELTAKMDAEFDKVRKDFFNLSILERSGSGISDLIKLDNKAIMEFVDEKDKDKVKFNFDVDEFESETISVKAVGNHVEVHAQKKKRSGDQEKSEEFSRTFELPTGTPLNPEKITSSFYKDGVLTVEIPVADAISGKPAA